MRTCYIYFFPLKNVIAQAMQRLVNVTTLADVNANLGTIQLKMIQVALNVAKVCQIIHLFFIKNYLQLINISRLNVILI